MPQYVRVASLDEVPLDTGLVAEVNGQEIALFRVGSEVYALENECPHRGAALAFGDVRGETVFCPLHAWPFLLRDGGCPEFPEVSVRTFPVHVEGGAVEVEL